MQQFKKTMFIPKPLEAVFAYVSDLRNDVHFAGPVKSVRFLNGEEPVVGRQSEMVAEFLGQEILTSHEVTEYEPNKKLSIKAITGPPSYDTRTVKAVDGGTELTFDMGIELHDMYNFTVEQLTEMAQKQVDEDFVRLKGLLESI